MNNLTDEVVSILKSLARRANPNYRNWWSVRDAKGNILPTDRNRCLICDEIILGYQSIIDHAFDHLKDKGLLIFI